MMRWVKINACVMVILCCVTACQGSGHRTTSNDGVTLTAIQKEFLAEANSAYQSGAFKKAIPLYRHLLDSYPDHIKFMFYYSEALRLSGQHSSAVRSYDAILEKNPDYMPAKEGKALVYLDQGRLDDAEKLLTDVLQMDASRWRTANALGVIYALRGEVDEAKEYYNIAISIDRNNPSVLNNVALSMTLLGDWPDALLVMDEAIKLVQSDKVRQKQLELNLALIYGLMDETSHAERILRKHLSEPAVFNNLGLYARLNDDESLAKAYLSKALVSSPVHYERAWKNLNNGQKIDE